MRALTQAGRAAGLFQGRFGSVVRVDQLVEAAVMAGGQPSGSSGPKSAPSTCSPSPSPPLKFPVPADLCVGLDAEGKPFLPASVLLGIFDHYSTYKIAEVDRTNRPGVSISLAIDLFDSHREYLRPGGELVLDCRVNKSGRSIGFMECHIRDSATHTMVAHCRHVKFLPMGWWWDLLFNRKVMPATLAAVKLFAFTDSVIKLQRKFFGPAGQSAHADGALPTLTEMLIPFEHAHARNSRGDGDSGDGAAAPKTASATFGPMQKSHTNPVGGLHGGFQALMVEKLATRLAGRSDVRSMQMTYYRESQHALTLDAEIMGSDVYDAAGGLGDHAGGLGVAAGPTTGTGVRCILSNEKKGVMSQGFVQLGEGLSQGRLPVSTQTPINR